MTYLPTYTTLHTYLPIYISSQTLCTYLFVVGSKVGGLNNVNNVISFYVSLLGFNFFEFIFNNTCSLM
jgi:hypothetical protein